MRYICKLICTFEVHAKQGGYLYESIHIMKFKTDLPNLLILRAKYTAYFRVDLEISSFNNLL